MSSKRSKLPIHRLALGSAIILLIMVALMNATTVSPGQAALPAWGGILLIIFDIACWLTALITWPRKRQKSERVILGIFDRLIILVKEFKKRPIRKR